MAASLQPLITVVMGVYLLSEKFNQVTMLLIATVASLVLYSVSVPQV